MPGSSSTRWNIFARELEDILHAHNLRLSQLNDLSIDIHREKVRRLQQSLKSPRHLTTLNPDEIERLVIEIGMTELEQKRLRAALLATAVEMTLMDRIDPQTALMASNDVFHILFGAMEEQPNTTMTTRVRAGAMIDDSEMYGDTLFTQALDLIDRAILAVHVSRNAASLPARTSRAREAFETFAQSLKLLLECDSPSSESEDWRYWYSEATDGQRMAEALLQSGGA